GISKKAFEASNGFGKIHPGEDPDLSIRLWNLGFKTALIPNAYVFHKRRIDWEKFYKQINKFGKARPILNQRYPQYSKITYWFPTLFIARLLLSVVLFCFGFYWLSTCFVLYFLILLLESFIQTKNAKIAVL